MSREIDVLGAPLSDEDREYLKQRSRHYDIEENDRIFGNGKFAEKGDDEVEPVFAPTPTVPQPPIEPGSAADNPPRFVGNRPHGVDRAVWGGATGLSEQEAYEATAPEPHTEVVATDDDLAWQEAKLANPESTQTASDPAPARDGEGDDEPDAIDELNVEELKDELRERDLSTSGNKQELRDRLREAVDKESE